MASTTLTLAQLTASGFQNLNPFAVDVIRQVLTKDNFTAQIPARGVSGIYNTYVRESTQVLAKTHAVAGTVSESVAVDVKTNDEVGRIISQISLDRKVAIGHNLTNPWGRQFQAGTWAMTQKWQNQVANGGGTAEKDISGLTKLADGAGSGQKYTPGTSTSGIALALVHLDKIKALLQYPCDFFVMNEKLFIDFKVLAQSAGGLRMEEYQRPFAVYGSDGRVLAFEEQTVRVPTYDGVPIYINNYLGTETTKGGSGKYRIIAGSFEPGKGLEYFYPVTDDKGMPTALGIMVEPVQMKPDYDEKFVRVVHCAGLSLYSTKAIAHGINFKITNS